MVELFQVNEKITAQFALRVACSAGDRPHKMVVTAASGEYQSPFAVRLQGLRIGQLKWKGKAYHYYCHNDWHAKQPGFWCELTNPPLLEADNVLWIEVEATALRPWNGVLSLKVRAVGGPTVRAARVFGIVPPLTQMTVK